MILNTPTQNLTLIHYSPHPNITLLEDHMALITDIKQHLSEARITKVDFMVEAPGFDRGFSTLIQDRSLSVLH